MGYYVHEEFNSGWGVKLKANEIIRLINSDMPIINMVLDEEEIEICKGEVIDINNSVAKKQLNMRIDEDGNLINLQAKSVISNFYAVYNLNIDYTNEYGDLEKLVLIDLYCFENRCGAKLILNMNDLKDSNWIQNFLGFGKYKLFGDYNKFKNVMLISNDFIKTKCVNCSGGWVKDKEEWSYRVNNKSINNFYIDYDKLDTSEKSIYLESLEFLNMKPLKQSNLIFSYCILSVLNEFLIKINIEPNFVLTFIGSKESLVSQFTDLFTYNISPYHGINKLHQDSEEHLTNLIDYDICGYSSDSIENTKRKLAKYKDAPVVIDGIINSNNNKQVTEKILKNYILKGNKRHRNETRRLNAFPIMIVDRQAELDLGCTYRIEYGDIDSIELLSYRKKDYILTYSIFNYIRWIEEKVNSDEVRLMKEFLDTFYYYRKVFYYNCITNTERDANIYAWLSLAVRTYLAFGLYNDFISFEDYKNIHDEIIENISGFRLNDDEDIKKMYKLIQEEQVENEKKVKGFLEVINNIYENDPDKFLKVKSNATDDNIGWLYENSSDKNKYICFMKKYPDINLKDNDKGKKVNDNDDSDFISRLNNYIRKNNKNDFTLAKGDYMWLAKELKKRNDNNINSSMNIIKTDTDEKKKDGSTRSWEEYSVTLTANQKEPKRKLAISVEAMKAYLKNSGDDGKVGKVQ